MYQNYAILALVVFVYSTLARGIERTPFGGALLFITLGYVLGPEALGLLHFEVDRHDLRTIAELTLALLLFSDAAKANLRVLGLSYKIPWRMLVVGLPLTILLGFVAAAWLLPDLTGFEMALLATMLAPTDAALGKAVISNKIVPAEIRETLNVESGLNDGICVPILFLFLAMAVDAGASDRGVELALELVIKEIGIGVLVGVLLTLAMSWLLRFSARLGWIGGHWRPIHIVAMALSCFALAQTLGGSGFIAAFVGGLLFGRLVTRYKSDLLRATEGTGEALSLTTWVMFGGAIGPFMPLVTWQILLYSLLSLTVIRMLPMLIAFVGSGLRMPEKLFLGWFGPRGLASLVFAIIVMNEHLPGEKTLVITVVCTVTLSVIAHGLSANPLARALAAYERRHPKPAGDGEANH